MQRLGLGYEFYKQFIDENLYYIDKTLLIRDVVERGDKRADDGSYRQRK